MISYIYIIAGVTINYETGDSCLWDSNSVVTDIPATSGASNNNDASNSSSTDSDVTNSTAITETYIINENTHKFHSESKKIIQFAFAIKYNITLVDAWNQ